MLEVTDDFLDCGNTSKFIQQYTVYMCRGLCISDIITRQLAINKSINKHIKLKPEFKRKQKKERTW